MNVRIFILLFIFLNMSQSALIMHTRIIPEESESVTSEDQSGFEPVSFDMQELLVKIQTLVQAHLDRGEFFNRKVKIFNGLAHKHATRVYVWIVNLKIENKVAHPLNKKWSSLRIARRIFNQPRTQIISRIQSITIKQIHSRSWNKTQIIARTQILPTVPWSFFGTVKIYQSSKTAR